jgi:ribonucleoside-diphosphate reductase beta chain
VPRQNLIHTHRGPVCKHSMFSPDPNEIQAFALPELHEPEIVMARTTVTDIVNARRVIDGPSDKLRAVSATKYPWTRPLWAKMRGNRWEVEQVNLVRDKQEFALLSPEQRRAFRRSLAFLSNLDSIQTENLAQNVSLFITDPTILQLIARQQFEEWIHVEMYSAIVESLFSDPMEVYDMYRQVPLLKEKNDFIARTSAEVTLDPTPENKVKAIVSNIALEGVYFFTGFLTFYAIARNSLKMNGTVDGIRYIQRDELTHLEIFVNAYLTVRQENPKLFTSKLIRECHEILDHAQVLEASWGKYVVGDGIPFVTHETIDSYTVYLRDLRKHSIGLIDTLPKNPIPWVDAAASINGVQGNFFESKPMTYTENKPSFTRRTTPR